MPVKLKSAEMSDEVKAMVQLRHGAEQRGNFEPLGRLQWLRTEHGMIQFPAVNGEGCGPDLAWTDIGGEVDLYKNSAPPPPDFALCVLGQWQGLPPLRVNTRKPCPRCRHACDVCDGGGKKLCELCGGRKWIPGPWLPCPGPGCVRDSGGFASGTIKQGCATCGASGQVPEQKHCPMCEGSAQITCSRCQGSGKYSTGRINGSVDWDVSPKCKFCAGTCCVGEWKPQKPEAFMNATLCIARTAKTSAKGYLVLGPISEFAIRDPRTLRTRIFDVSADAAGDWLVLLVPRSRLQKPQKAYLVGGIVRERRVLSAVSA